MKTFHEKIKDKFDWDVSALDPYTDEQSTMFIEDLIASSKFLSRINTQDGNKGSEDIKLLSSVVTVQAATTCGWNASGGVVYTDETLTTKRLKVQEEYCNEDLNGTWAQMTNAAGANRQDTEMPMQAVIEAYYIKKVQKRIQDLVINGDTASLDANLTYFDGMRKKLKADADVVVATVPYPTITDDNGFDALKVVEAAIPRDVKDNGLAHEIVVDYAIARNCLNQVWNDKDFSAEVDFTDEDGEISFMLPSTRTMVRSMPQLNNTEEVYVFVYPYIFYGTDTAGDENGFEAKYNETDEKLRFSVKWRSGVEYVLPQYFVRMARTLS